MPVPHLSSTVVQVAPTWSRLRGSMAGLSGPFMRGEVAIVWPALAVAATASAAAQNSTVQTPTGVALDAALVAALNELAELVPAARLPATTYETPALHIVHALLHWCCELQQHAKVAVVQKGLVWSSRQQDAQTTRHELLIPVHRHQAARATLNWCAETANALLAQTLNTSELTARLAALMAALKPHAEAGNNRLRFVQAAARLGVPTMQMFGDVWALGHGAHRRWLDSSSTDRTSAISIRLTRDKINTASVLRQAGLPVPVHLAVGNAQEAQAAATRLGFPVVVKPIDRDQGDGVSAGLMTADDVATAYDLARTYSPRVMVERHVEGQEYRLTVVHGRVVKVVLRRAGGVEGDGQRSVAELVEHTMQDPVLARRSRERGRPVLALDDEALQLLAQVGLAASSVPAPGHFVRLRRRGNISQGGSATLLATTAVHPDNLRLAVLAAEVTRLDMAGIDFIAPDVTRSWREGGAVICEVNGKPQIGASNTPEIYADIVRELVPEGGHVPAQLWVGCEPSAAPTTTPGAGHGLSSRAGVWVDGQWCCGPFASGFDAAHALLALPSVKSATCSLTLAEVQRDGLPMPRASLIVVAAPAGQAAQWRRLLAPHADALEFRPVLAPAHV